MITRRDSCAHAGRCWQVRDVPLDYKQHLSCCMISIKRMSRVLCKA